MAASDGERDRRQDERPGSGGRGALLSEDRPAGQVRLGLAGGPTAAAVASDLDLSDAEQLYHTGHYDECARMAAGEITAQGYGASPLGPLEVPVRTGPGQVGGGAMATLKDAERRYPASIALRLMGRDLYRETGREEEAATELNTIERLILRCALSVRHARGPPQPRGDSSGSVAPMPGRCSTNSTTSPRRKGPATSRPILPRPSWRWRNRTMPWRRRHSKGAQGRRRGPEVPLPARACFSADDRTRSEKASSTH